MTNPIKLILIFIILGLLPASLKAEGIAANGSEISIAEYDKCEAIRDKDINSLAIYNEYLQCICKAQKRDCPLESSQAQAADPTLGQKLGIVEIPLGSRPLPAACIPPIIADFATWRKPAGCP